MPSTSCWFICWDWRSLRKPRRPSDWRLCGLCTRFSPSPSPTSWDAPTCWRRVACSPVCCVTSARPPNPAGAKRPGWLRCWRLSRWGSFPRKTRRWWSRSCCCTISSSERPPPRARNTWSARCAGYAVAALPLLVYWYCRSRVLAPFPHRPVAFLDNPLTGSDFWTARITAVRVLGKYLWLWLWPAKLACEYSYNQVPLFDWRWQDWEAWRTVAAVVAWGAILALAVRSYRRNKPLGFFIAFFLVTMAPTSNLVMLIGSIMAERFLYLPSIGFAAGAIVALHWAYRPLTRAWPGARLAVPIALVAICAVLASRTYARNADWLDGDSLWTSAVRSAPASYKTHLDLALTALGNQPPDLDLAAHELEISLAITGGLPGDRQKEQAYPI